MPDLRFEPVSPAGDDAVLLDWQYVHNLIIPTDPLAVLVIRERAQRNRLFVAYLGDLLVGCSTVRPPADNSGTATVIARVLPQHRRQGFGEQIYRHAQAIAHQIGAHAIETCVLLSNQHGLRFAERHGFVEIDRYVLDGQTIPFIDLRLEAR